MSFHVGEQVRVVSIGETDDPHGMGEGAPWVNSWKAEPMNYAYDEVFTIEDIDPYMGIKFVSRGADDIITEYYYPANILKREPN